ncbi:hypothetical protein V492_03805 [Pseudogymnoascus sp. VKM F-4246]|nr:hypothetical protein V492_03805 [Pseudogymnoascus sp. VKM F-4246]
MPVKAAVNARKGDMKAFWGLRRPPRLRRENWPPAPGPTAAPAILAAQGASGIVSIVSVGVVGVDGVNCVNSVVWSLAFTKLKTTLCGYHLCPRSVCLVIEHNGVKATMKFLFAFALLHPLLLAGATVIDRKLPADIQFDLLFPRNETYAPTQEFPIVFGMNNVDAVWPLEINLYLDVQSIGMLGSNKSSRVSWTIQPDFYFPAIYEQFNQEPRKQYFHFPATNITNGTTDSYIISWNVAVSRECFVNGTLVNDTENHKSRSLEFSTAPGAKLPDIEASINSCPERNANNSVALRVTNVTSPPYAQGVCPLFSIKPEKCVFKSAAKGVAANVSASMLQAIGCEEGDWRTITAPCLPKVKESTALRQSVGSAVGLLLLAFVFAILNDF